MTKSDVDYAKSVLLSKIASLKNDFSRAYFDLEKDGLQTSPFPILMFTMAVLDFFSSIRAGWSESSGPQGRFQTQRLISFCTDQLGYGHLESTILIKIHRHSLMHTADPRIRSSHDGSAVYTWAIMNIGSDNMHLKSYTSPNPTGSVQMLNVVIGNIIDDLENYLTKSGGYFDTLEHDTATQSNYIQCLVELDAQTI